MGFKAQIEEVALDRRDTHFTKTNKEREERIVEMNKICWLLGGKSRVCSLNDLDFSVKHEVRPSSKISGLEMAG